MVFQVLNPNNPFLVDKNYRQSHKVEKNETLGHIMHAYYGGSGLNMKFVEMAIVQLNSHAFVSKIPIFFTLRRLFVCHL